MKKLLRLIAYSFANRLFGILQNAQRTHLISTLKSCGKDITLCMPIWIGAAENVVLGDNVLINAYAHIWAQGGVRIGNRVMIASHVAITTLTHDYRAVNMQSCRRVWFRCHRKCRTVFHSCRGSREDLEIPECPWHFSWKSWDSIGIPKEKSAI